MDTQTIRHFPGTARPHVGLGVRDLARSRVFYEALLGVAPTKLREGYAKFEPVEPSLNLSLNETPHATPNADGVSHFGIELRSVGAVEAAAARLEAAGLAPRRERTTCCFAEQEKAWVTDPDGHEWEMFVVLADADVADGPSEKPRACCAPTCCAPA